MDDPLRVMLSTFAAHAGPGSPAASMAGLASAGLAFSSAVADGSGSPTAVLAAAASLSGAHARAIEQVTGGAVRSDGSLDAHLALTSAVVARLEALPADVGWRDAMEIAALMQGEPLTVAPRLPNASPLDEALAVLASQPRPAAVNPVPELRVFANAHEAVVGLLDSVGAHPTEEDMDALGRLRLLPAATDRALADVVAAYLMVEDAARIGFPATAAGFESEDVDWGMLLAARDKLAETIARIPAPPPGPRLVTTPGEGHECLLGVSFCFDLLAERSVYSDDAVLIIDIGGDDMYVNNGGGGSTTPALLVDFAGNDSYLGSDPDQGAVNGGAYLSMGALYDREGNDIYGGLGLGAGRVGVNGGINGGGYAGVGLLLDGGGHDTYAGSTGSDGAINGGAAGLVPVGISAGYGALLDLGGDDVYAGVTSGRGGVNGGSALGRGLLFDATGHDAYGGTVGLSGGVNGGGTEGAGQLIDLGGADDYGGSVGGDGGVNGGAIFGTGFLFDQGGDDNYAGTVERGGVNAGTHEGAGALIDAAGNDVYRGTVATPGGVNGGASVGSALLADFGGDDVYGGAALESGGVNGASRLGVGVLYDALGSDTYDGSVADHGGVNGATLGGLGLLVDRDGSNSFLGTPPAHGGVNGAAESFTTTFPVGSVGPDSVTAFVPLGLGLLLAGPGDDQYASAGVTQGAAANYAIGLLVDMGGSNKYTAGPLGLAQGAGATLGIGVLVDLALQTYPVPDLISAASFEILGGTAGQGAGIQGVGLLHHAGKGAPPGSEIGITTFEAAPTALPSLVGGGGVGLRFVGGAGEFIGTPPQLECATPDDEIAVIPLSGDQQSYLRVCAPDDGGATRLVNPLDGHELADVPKTPLCEPGDTGAAECELLVGTALGPEAVTWLRADHVTPTTSGGLVIVQTEVDAVKATQGKETMGSADDACQVSCHTIHAVT